MAVKNPVAYNQAKTGRYTNASGSTQVSGTIVQIGMNFGRLMADVANGATGLAQMTGVIKVAKTADSEAFVEGDKVYFLGQEPTRVPQGYAAGYAYKAASAGQTYLYVVLTPGMKTFYCKRLLTAAEVTALAATLSLGGQYTGKATTVNAAIMSDETTSRSSSTTTVNASTITIANAGIVTGDMVRVFIPN